MFISSCEHFPMLSVLISSLINEVSANDSGLTSLSTHSNLTQMLRKIKHILWNNAPIIASPLLDFLTNEEKYFKSSVKNFLLTFLTSISQNVDNIDHIFDLIQSVQLHLKTMSLEKSTKKFNEDNEISSVQQIILSLEEIKRIISELESEEVNERWSLIAKGWIFFGQAQLIIFSSLDSVDPIEKKSLKSEYARDEVNKLDALLSVNGIYKTIIGFNGCWPLEKEYKERIEHLKLKLEKLSKDVAVRPYPPAYNDIIKDLNVLMESICSYSTLRDLSKRLSGCNDSKEYLLAIKESHGWLLSIESWIDNLYSLYSVTYPDIVIPPLLALLHMDHGVRLLSSQCLKSSVCNKFKTNSSPEYCLKQLSLFPITSVDSALNLLTWFNNETLKLLFEQSSLFKSSQSSISSFIANNKLKLGKCWLHLLRTLSGVASWTKILSSFLPILDIVVRTWQVQLREEEEKQAKEDSIYVYKKPLTEEEQDNLEIAELFPTFRDSDFGDLEENLSLEETCKIKKSKMPRKTTSLTNSDIEIICNLHSAIVRENVDTHWISGVKNTDNYKDHVSCLQGRLQLFNDTITGNHVACSKALDEKAFTALYLSIDLPKVNHSMEDKNESLYDFYRDPNISEVRKCLPLLWVINARVKELRAEWPDHPTLNKILEMIERIVSFDVSSPLARFLTGLDMLLVQLYMWEENAHSGVSLAQHCASVTAQIIEWRKLELHSWKGALHATTLRVIGKASKWWFHLYALIGDYLLKTEKDGDVSEIIDSLEMFMEKSTLGEYSTRLELLFTFHCHCTLIPPSHKQRMLCYIFWNLFNYYHQFSQSVGTKIKDLSSPIEKKIKDFVKIARWNDINYWSVKSSAEKTHRTLHKYIKEFERVLQQPASTAMTKPEIINDKKIVKFSVKKYISQLEFPITDNEKTLDVLQGPIDYVKKSQKLCKEALVKCQYPKFISSLGQYITDINEVGSLLNQTEVDAQLTGDKKKSAAKSLLQKKRKAVSDLFKSLNETGLSYRTGLLKIKVLKDFTFMQPINPSISIKKFNKRYCDNDLVSSWSNTDRLIMTAVSSCSLLSAVVTKPHKDLSPQTIDRIKGYTSQLLSLCFDEKKSLTDFILKFYFTRSTFQHLNTICGTKSSTHSQLTLSLKNSLNTVSVEIIYVLEQFQIVLDSCPQRSHLISGEESIPSICLCKNETSLSNSFKHDATWDAAKNKLDLCISSAKKIAQSLKIYENQIQFLSDLNLKINENQSIDELFVPTIFHTVMQGFEKLRDIHNNLIFIKNNFDISVNNEEFKNPLATCLVSLINNINKALLLFEDNKDKLDINDSKTDIDLNFKNKVSSFTNKILFIIQEFFKMFSSTNEDNKENTSMNSQVEAPDDDGYEIIEESHIKDKLVESFSKLNSVLRIEEINEEISDILACICQHESHQQTECISIVHQSLPLLDQLLHVYQYFIVEKTNCLKTLAKLTTTLSSLFTNFSKKGFNIPDELLCDEEGEEGGEGMKGGMGLGDGEGEKDVSDQIESQDQLDDAKKPEDYDDQPQDKDCKEEENGIEVSEDFGGKLQDVDKKEDEEGKEQESDGEGDDADKEMGETGQTSDLLDQQVWGGESDEEEEGEMGEDDRGDKGQQQGDKEMGAKDDEKKATDEQPQPLPERPDAKQEINEINENEMDDDQIDPYYGKQPSYPEVEPLDLEDDLELDDQDGGKDQDDGDPDMENPFENDQEKTEVAELPEEEAMEETKENQDGDKGDDTASDGEDEVSPEMGDLPTQDDQDQEDGDESKVDKDSRMELEEEDNQVEEEEKGKQDEAVGSEDKSSETTAEASQQKYGSRDQVKEGEEGESCQEENVAQGEDKEGVGAAETSLDKGGHQGQAGQGKRKGDENQDKQTKSKPGHSDVDRTLGEFSEPVQKKLKTIGTKEDDKNDSEDREEEGGVEDESADLYQHIKESKGHEYDALTVDAATQEQAEKQPVINKEDEAGEELKEEDEPMQLDEDDVKEEQKGEEMKADKMDDVEKNKDNKKGEGTGDALEEATVDVEGEFIETMKVERSTESSYHTHIIDHSDFPCMDENILQTMRLQVENQLASWNQTPGNSEAISTWEKLCSITEELARQLSQELRIVLEPTTASSLKGDFRTGRRINMRKVIPYIASQFRKDKIWLRRTKPSKREYQIILAIDDSSSMSDNHSKELAFESLALVSKALGLLEAGDLSVVSFGETIKILHRLGDIFDQHCGGKLVQEFSFDQKRTRVGGLVEFAVSQFSTCTKHTDSALAQLLVIVSDGRGVMSEGEDKIRSAVRTAVLNNLFIIFLIIDNPTSKDSILDIRMPKFVGGKLLEITSYMDNFPFPFYVILRDINNLPTVLSDALRQWFELVTNTS